MKCSFPHGAPQIIPARFTLFSPGGSHPSVSNVASLLTYFWSLKLLWLLLQLFYFLLYQASKMLVNSNSPMMRQFPASLDLLQAPAFSSPVFSPPQSFRREFSKAHCLSQAQYLAPLKALLFRLSRLDPEMLSWVLCLVGGKKDIPWALLQEVLLSSSKGL